jgi:hypothetical protein
MVQKTMAYDHAAYISRAAFNVTPASAGSGAASGKFYAFTQLQLMSVSFAVTTAGTSTYTVGSTATSPATQASVLVVQNTSSTSIALATSTYGPFTIGGPLGTATGGFLNYAVNTATGTAGQGGITINPGAAVYCVNGTDATAVYTPMFEFQITPLAPVTL